MDVTIASEKENKLLDRKEMEARISYKGATPNKKEIRDAIAKSTGIAAELIAVRQITNEFGRSSIKVEAHAYDSKESLEKYEPEYVQVRYGKPKKEKKAAAKPEEAKEKK